MLSVIIVTLLCVHTNRSILRGQILPFRNYTIADGLISDNINDVCEDSLGFIWIATSDGLSKFDSQEFVNYTTADGLASNNLSCILADRSLPGVVWIGTARDGIVRFSNGLFRNYRIDHGPDQRGVNGLFQDPTGRVWGGTDGGLIYIEKDSMTRDFRWLSNVSISSISGSPRGSVVVGTSQGVFLLEGTDRPPVHFDCTETLSKRINIVFVDSRNNLWVSAYDGTIVMCKESDPKQHFQIRNINGPTRFSEDAQHTIWICTKEGLLGTNEFDFEKGNITRIGRKAGLQDEDLNSVMVGREGIIWMSSYRSGLVDLTSTSLIRFDFEQKKNRMWSSAACDRFNHFWVTDGESLMELYKNTNGIFEMVRHPLPPAGSSSQLMKLLCDNVHDELLCAYSDGRILVFHILHEGISRSVLDPSRLIDLKRFTRIGWLQTACLDAQGRLWCSILNRGVAVLDRRSSHVMKWYTSVDGLPDISVRAIFQDKSGSMWIGGFDHGLTKLQDDRAKKGSGGKVVRSATRFFLYSTNNGLPDNGVRAIAEDKNDDILVGTRYGGLAVLRDDSVFRIGRSMGGLISDGIWSLQPLPDGRVFICTQAGVQVVSPVKNIQFVTLDRVPKIPYYCSALSEEGYVCFASGKAVFIYDTRDVSDLHKSLPVYLTRVLVDGKQADIEKINTLPSRTRSITFEFVEVANRMGDRVYQYRLLGVDDDFRTLFGKNSITFAGLRAGTYRFEVYGLNGNVRSANPASLTFTIQTPLYARWYFILLSIGFVISIIFLFHRQRRHSNAEVRKIRQRIAMDLHDEIGSGLTKIAILSDYVSSELIPSGNENTGAGPMPVPQDNELPVVESPTDRIGRIARGLVDSIADVVWSIDPRYDTLADFIFSFQSYANELVEARGIKMDIKVIGIDKVKINSQVKRVLQLLSKEALNNAIKYSGCKNIVYSLEVKKRRVFLSFRDDGCGFDRSTVELGNGLNNMEKHARDIKGSLTIESALHCGTKILFEFPLQV